MAKTSFLLFSLLFIFVFAFPGFVSAQDEVELILEEFEGGYIIVNWEDTIVYVDENEQENVEKIPDIEELVLEEAGEGLVVVNWEDTKVYGNSGQPAENKESATKKKTKTEKKVVKRFRGSKKNN